MSETSEFLQHFANVMDAREEAAAGLYCECKTPAQYGSICTHCGLCIREVEVRQVLRIVSAHDFTPDSRHEELCGQCSNWATHPRHHGDSDIGRLRDGTQVHPGETVNIVEVAT